MPTVSVDQLLDSIDDLHSCPAVVQRILQLTADDDYEVGQVASCLASDPALASSVLRLVNSSRYGLRQKTASLDRAATHLGRRSLRLAVLSFGLVERLTRATPARFFESYWRRALTMACASQLCIARLGVNREDEDEAYSAGLLADLAVLIFARLDPDRYTALYLDLQHQADLAAAEREIYGADHSTLSSLLLKRWHFPLVLTDAVAGYQEFAPEKSMFAHALFAGSLLTECLWTPGAGHTPQLCSVFEQLFHLDMDQLISLAITCKDMYTDARELFKMELSGEIDVEALRHEAWRQVQNVVIGQSQWIVGPETVVTEEIPSGDHS